MEPSGAGEITSLVNLVMGLPGRSILFRFFFRRRMGGLARGYLFVLILA
jgi:hypothetical protein